MIDIGHTANGDIDLQAGDILYAESTGQHQRDILLAIKDITRKARKRVWEPWNI